MTRDANDDYLVALAREHDAVWIVTGDDDLLEWDEQAPSDNRTCGVRAMADRTALNFRWDRSASNLTR